MFCNKCGTRLVEGSLFCNFCGQKQPVIVDGKIVGIDDTVDICEDDVHEEVFSEDDFWEEDISEIQPSCEDVCDDAVIIPKEIAEVGPEKSKKMIYRA